MDFVSIAATVVATLSPYLGKAAGKFADAAGGAAWNKTTELYQLLKERVAGTPGAHDALAELEKMPGDAAKQAALSEQLKKLIADDPDFLKQVASLTEAAHNAAGSLVSARVQVMPPFKPLLHNIIGRDDLVKEIASALISGHRTVALLHLPGIGKTTLAAMLAKDETLLKNYPDGLLWAHLGLDPDIRAELFKWAYALGVPEARMKNFKTPAEWSEAISQAIGARRMLLIVDDVWEASAGDYFLIGGENCAHIATTRFPMVATGIATAGFEVRKLNIADGVALLSGFAPQAIAAEPIAAAVLVELVDGLPLALVLMGHYLRQAGKFKQAGRIRAALDALHDMENLFSLQHPAEYPTDTPRSLAGVIETSYRALGKNQSSQIQPVNGDELRRVLECLSVLRPDPAKFSFALAAFVADASGTALYELSDAGLIEVMHAENGEESTNEQYEVPHDIGNRSVDEISGESYAMHRTIAEYVRTKLTPERAKALHLRAATYYRERLNGLEEQYQKAGSDYQGWYRYENIEWQDCKDNWLYHLSKTDEQQLAISAFLRAWFDGFWWWGCFLDFNFCDQLLREWGQRKVVPEAEQGLLLLSRFMQVYPKETSDRGTGNWQLVQTLLNEVRQRAKLDGDPELLTSIDARHVRGLTSIFLAEAQRFGRRDFQAAEVLYRDALAMFERNDDAWDMAWTLYHLADMLSQCEKTNEAQALCRQALPLGEKECDPEVIANLYRVWGDIDCIKKNFDAAADHYDLAVQNAYRFQIEPEAPDAYTIRFYAQVAEQVCTRLLGICEDAEPEALKMALALREAWQIGDAADGSTLKEALHWRDAKTLLANIFPAPLAAEALQNNGKRYASGVKAKLAAVCRRHDKNIYY